MSKGWKGDSKRHSLASKGIKTSGKYKVNEHTDSPSGTVEVSKKFGRLRRTIKKQLDKELKDIGINPDDFKFSFFYVDDDDIIGQAEYKHNFRNRTLVIGGIFFNKDNGEILQRNSIELG